MRCVTAVDDEERKCQTTKDSRNSSSEPQGPNATDCEEFCRLTPRCLLYALADVWLINLPQFLEQFFSGDA